MSSTYAEEVANDITRSNSIAKLLRWLQAKWAERQRRQAAASSSTSGCTAALAAALPAPWGGTLAVQRTPPLMGMGPGALELPSRRCEQLAGA